MMSEPRVKPHRPDAVVTTWATLIGPIDLEMWLEGQKPVLRASLDSRIWIHTTLSTGITGVGLFLSRNPLRIAFTTAPRKPDLLIPVSVLGVLLKQAQKQALNQPKEARRLHQG